MTRAGATWAHRAALLSAAALAGCNPIVGIEPPEHDKESSSSSMMPPDAGDRCAGVTCKALDACHDVGVCDPATGQCSNPLSADGKPCETGDGCTQNSACRAGVCTPLNIDREWATWTPLATHKYAIKGPVAIDDVTGLTWQQAVPNRVDSWQGAQDYCKKLNLAGYPSGWRLPTRIELESIVDYGTMSPAIDSGTFPGTPPDVFWTSSADIADATLAWAVNFNDGSVPAMTKTTALHVRCVR